MSDDYLPLACAVYDELELACVRGREVTLSLDGEEVVGVPVTLVIEGGVEWLVVRLADGVERRLRLDRIREFRNAVG